jgi:hypothetical protein
MACDDFEDELDIDEFENDGKVVDVCPSCGVLLSDPESITEGCNDPMGCAIFLDLQDEEEYEDDDDEIEELNFDKE